MRINVNNSYYQFEFQLSYIILSADSLTQIIIIHTFKGKFYKNCRPLLNVIIIHLIDIFVSTTAIFTDSYQTCILRFVVNHVQ